MLVRIGAVCVLSVLLAGMLAGCSRADAHEPPPKAEVQALAAQLRATQQAAYLLDITHKTLVTGTDNGGELYAFRSREGLRIITVKIGVSNRTVATSVYYGEDGQIFAFVVDELPAGATAPELRTKGRPQPPDRRTYLIRAKQVVDVQETGTVPEPILSFSHIARDAAFFKRCAAAKQNELDIEGFVQTGRTELPHLSGGTKAAP